MLVDESAGDLLAADPVPGEVDCRYGDRYVFTHDRNEVLNLAADVVERIAYADVPKATKPAPKVGAV